jgi:hypothetical protein
MKKHVMICFAALGLFLITGCVAPHRQAITLDESAFSPDISTIYVMPVIDARSDKTAKLEDKDFKRMREMAKEILGRFNHYQSVLVDSWGTGGISDQSLADMNASELSSLAPPEARIFLVITINDVRDNYKVLTTAYSMTGTLMAIDRQQKREVWKDAATGTASGGGLLGAAFAQIGKEHDAQQLLLGQVFVSFPRKQK